MFDQHCPLTAVFANNNITSMLHVVVVAVAVVATAWFKRYLQIDAWPALVRIVSWCVVCAVRCGTRVSSSQRGVPRHRGACASSSPGITEVPPSRVNPARSITCSRINFWLDPTARVSMCIFKKNNEIGQLIFRSNKLLVSKKSFCFRK